VLCSPSPSFLQDVRQDNVQRGHPSLKHKRPRILSLSPADDAQCQESSEYDDDDLEIEINTSISHRTAKKKKRKSNASTPKPTTLGFFPPLWVRLLDCAKANFRRHLALVSPFPQHEVAIDGACVEALTAAMVQWQELECQVEKGAFSQTVYKCPTDNSIEVSS
jgi:hypothetical protein